VSRFDRYLLSQLLALFGFFSLVLVAIYWVNRAVGLFDKLIGDGQSALVFLEFSALTLPNVIRLVLPISAFIATVYATNRLASESELVVMQATGFSAFRLARPVVYFGLIVALMMLILMHVLVPASRTMLALRTAEISQNVTARFLNDGQFMHPSNGVTLYIREITPTGELLDLYLNDARSSGAQVTYTATRALLVRGETGAKLVMVDGMIQSLRDSRLAVTRFADFTYDLGDVIGGSEAAGRTIDELSTAELFRADAAVIEETGETRAAFLFEAHSRFAQPFLALAAALIGFAALVSGGFSRFGLWPQVGLAVVLLIFVQMINTGATSAGLKRESAVLLAYVAPIVGVGIASFILWQSQWTRRRPKAVAA
jgi:lipopolysaccharide export system permease protein